MSKVDKKLDKQFISELTGSLKRSALGNNKKLLNLFDMLNEHITDDTIDIKEITDFANSIFEADTNKDGEVNKKELDAYMKEHEIKYQGTNIKSKDILEFLNIFHLNSDKTDKYNQRITNTDGSYSIIYKEQITEKKEEVPTTREVEKKINYSKDNKVLTNEQTYGNKTIITDSDGRFITRQKKENGKVISETKANGITYIYAEDKTIIEKDNKEILTIPDGKILLDIKESKAGLFIATIQDTSTEEISQETIYTDDYRVVSFSQSHYISLEGVKSVINDGITICSFPTILENGPIIINSLCKEEDREFKNKYVLGMLNKTIELANLIQVDTTTLTDITKEIETKGIENISIEKLNDIYISVIDKMKAKNPDTITSQIDNKYYHSDKTYTKITTDNSIVIIDNKTKKKTTLDLSKILKPFPKDKRAEISKSLKSINAEALLDLSVEVTFDNKYVGDGADGSFSSITDRLSLYGGSYKADTILHELGHALDAKGKGAYSFQTLNNKKFKQIFQKEMKAFLKAGNKRCVAYYDSKDVYHTAHDTLIGAETNNNSTYATVDEEEMFAECYDLLMSGQCNSQEVIDKYFPQTRNYVLQMIKETRNLPDRKRHSG